MGCAVQDPQADGRKRDGTTRVEKAEVANFHKAMRTRHAGGSGGATPCRRAGWCGGVHCPNFPVGKGDGAAREAHETVVRDGDLEDIRGEVGASGVAVVLRLTVDVPGDDPDLGIDVLQQAGVVHVFFEARTGDGGERLHRNQEGGAGGAPGRAALGEAPAGHHVMDVRGVLELPPPGMQDPSEPQEIGPDEALIFWRAV